MYVGAIRCGTYFDFLAIILCGWGHPYFEPQRGSGATLPKARNSNKRIRTSMLSIIGLAKVGNHWSIRYANTE